MHDPGWKNKLLISPNPSNGNFSVNSSQNIDELKVTDVVGNIISVSRPGSQKASLQMENAGVYFVTVTSGKEISIRKIIVNK